MPYAIDRSNPMFPTIVESADGQPYNTVAMEVTHHHLQALIDHLKALQRLLTYGGQDLIE
jgi:hypothetical protein